MCLGGAMAARSCLRPWEIRASPPLPLAAARRARRRRARTHRRGPGATRLRGHHERRRLLRQRRLPVGHARPPALGRHRTDPPDLQLELDRVRARSLRLHVLRQLRGEGGGAPHPGAPRAVQPPVLAAADQRADRLPAAALPLDGPLRPPAGAALRAARIALAAGGRPQAADPLMGDLERAEPAALLVRSPERARLRAAAARGRPGDQEGRPARTDRHRGPPEQQAPLGGPARALPQADLRRRRAPLVRRAGDQLVRHDPARVARPAALSAPADEPPPRPPRAHLGDRARLGRPRPTAPLHRRRPGPSEADPQLLRVPPPRPATPPPARGRLLLLARPGALPPALPRPLGPPHRPASARRLGEAGLQRVRAGGQAPALGERVLPADLAEAREIGVARAHREPMLERQRRQLGVGGEVAPDLVAYQQLTEQTRVLGSGLRDPRDRRGEPVGNPLPGGRRLQRSLEGPRVRRDAQKRDEGLPRQPDASQSVELSSQPVHGGAVLPAPLVDRVEQEIRVEQDHGALGPSSVSIASPMLEKSTPAPRSCVLWWNCCAERPPASPLRTSAFTASLSPSPRSRRSFSTAAATSSASVTVVRMSSTLGHLDAKKRASPAGPAEFRRPRIAGQRI